MQEKYVGTVKWFNAIKGYGFIGPEDAVAAWFNTERKDIFVHYTAILDSGYKKLIDGDRVEFVVAEGVKGKKQAEQVVKV
jgi:CspA family cold shock protein